MANQQAQEYKGVMTLPGEQDERGVSLAFNPNAPSVSIRFDAPVDGATDFEARGLVVENRPKYTEAVFFTEGLPKAGIEVTWKFNGSLLDDSLAGVVIARPNDQRITGEKGFVLTKSA